MTVADNIKVYALYTKHTHKEVPTFLGAYVAEDFDSAVLKCMTDHYHEYLPEEWTFSLTGNHQVRGSDVFYVGRDGKPYYE